MKTNIELQDNPQSKERVGVYIGHSGSNIAAVVDVAEVARWAADELAYRGAVAARD